VDRGAARIVEVVFGSSRARAARFGWCGWAIAIALHGAILGSALVHRAHFDSSSPPLGGPRPVPSEEIAPLEVALDPESAAPPTGSSPAPTEPGPTEAVPRSAPADASPPSVPGTAAATPSPQRSAAPSPPAAAPGRSQEPTGPVEAGTIVGTVASDEAPVDLSADVLVSGTAAQHAGGATSSSGAPGSLPGGSPGGTGAVVSGRPGGAGRGAGASAPDRSSPVRLAQNGWQCPWPRTAESSDVEEQVAVVRVYVRSDGAVEAVQLVVDPGQGFGDAAIRCARAARFTPARDRQGRPAASLSPLVRVRFTR
jgi:protein TonB